MNIGCIGLFSRDGGGRGGGGGGIPFFVGARDRDRGRRMDGGGKTVFTGIGDDGRWWFDVDG